MTSLTQGLDDDDSSTSSTLSRLLRLASLSTAKTTMSPSKHSPSLHIDLPLQHRSEYLLRETLLKDAEATPTPPTTTSSSSSSRRRTSTASRSSSRTRALESSGGLWGWFWRDNGEGSSSASEEEACHLPTPLSPSLRTMSTMTGFFDEERRGRGRTANPSNKRSRAVESLEKLHSRSSSTTSAVFGASSGGKQSKFALGLDTVPSVGDLRVLVAAHDALTTSASSSNSNNTPLTTSASISTPPTSFSSSPVSSSDMSSPHTGLEAEGELHVPEDVLITPPPTPPSAFSSKRPLGLDPSTPTLSRIPVSSQNAQRQHRRALSVSIYPQHPQVRTAATTQTAASASTPSTPQRSTSFRSTTTPGGPGKANYTPKRANSLRTFTPTTRSAAGQGPTTPTPTRVHKLHKALPVQAKSTGSPIPGAAVPSGFAVGTPTRKVSLVDRSPETPQRKALAAHIHTPTHTSPHTQMHTFMPGTPQSTKLPYRKTSFVASSPSSPRRNTSAASLPVVGGMAVTGNGQSPFSSPRRTRTATTLAEMATGGRDVVIPQTPKTFLYSREETDGTPGTSPPASPNFVLNSPRHPTDTSPTSPSSQNRFNIRTASEQCKAQEGYVSFASVEGLGEPEAPIEVLVTDDRGEKKRRWFGF
ncbi:hypothetical protein L218DRAFT_958932 [Marasmius fiardii PR-910]|nr:hypothetical protein L218DRAFT_958932 [Marasmius fiardii PR-910]